jgi:hypothetical protein
MTLILLETERMHKNKAGPVAARSKASALIAWKLMSWIRIPLKVWMFSSSFCVVLSCVDTGLCDGPITRPKESHQVSKQITKPSVRGGQGPFKDCRTTEEEHKNNIHNKHFIKARWR